MFYEWRHAEQMSIDRQGQKVNVGKNLVHSMAKDKHVGTCIKNEVAVHHALYFSLTVSVSTCSILYLAFFLCPVAAAS